MSKAEREALTVVEAQQQTALNSSQAERRAQEQLQDLQNTAQVAWQKALRAQELRVFLYWLLLILPLLAIAGWLFVKKRKGNLLAVCLGLHLLCAVCLLCRAGALPAQLRRLCALHRRHCRHGAAAVRGYF